MPLEGFYFIILLNKKISLSQLTFIGMLFHKLPKDSQEET
jgi:hypothetical protein